MSAIKNIVLSLSLLALPVLSNALELGGNLPSLDVPSKGELLIDGKEVQHQPWSTNQITTGTPALIFHLAARMSSDSIIAPLKKRLDENNYEPDSFQSISIINLNDALWGTSGLVSNELEKNKREHPQAILVADDEGRGLDAWQLKKGTVAIILVDLNGEIRYLKQGKLNDDDINTIITLLDEEIAKSKI